MLINWRKQFFRMLWWMRKNPKGSYVAYLHSIQYEPQESLMKLQNERLCKLLLHAYEKVPYYKTILADCGVVQHETVHLKNFDRIPLLTKEIIRHEGDNLYAQDHKQRMSYSNTSGGSTGEPIKFIQDLDYSYWSYAAHRYFHQMALRDMGEPLVKLWGSERDVFQGSETLSTKFSNWMENITLLNSFIMSESNMDRYIAQWNTVRPCLVLAYTSSMLEFARYVERYKVNIYRPRVIVCSAEVLTEDVRTYIEKVLQCPVLNQYGSREVSLIACECPQKQGLHVFSLFNKVEILTDELQECEPGHMGDVIITNLVNYSMPLIRYKIGDTAVSAFNKSCTCGRGWPLIASITGRQSDHFCTQQGTRIHGEYFTHLFYNRPDIKQFQVIQRDYDRVEIYLVPCSPLSELTRHDIEDKIRLVLGNLCTVTFTIVDAIPRSASGKYRYTISEVPRSAETT